MRHLRNAVLAGLVLSASAAVAQDKGKWEVGADVAGFSSNKIDGASGSTTTFGLNGSTTVRVGKMVTDKISVEPNISFTHNSATGSSSTFTDLSVAALYHFKKMDGAKPGWYVRPWVAMSMGKVESGGSTVFDETRTNMGVGAGMKRTSMGVIWRAEAFFKMTPKKDTSPSETEMGIKLGGGFSP